MSKQIQVRRGTTNANNLFVGAEGEITMDTTTKGLRIHDGTTVGGFKIDTVVMFQAPTPENGYTWYRKYASGWVEQGGRNSGSNATGSNTFSIEMADTSYNVQITRLYPTTADDPASISIQARNLTTTSFQGRQTYATAASGGTGSGNSYAYCWEVKGMAA